MKKSLLTLAAIILCSVSALAQCSFSPTTLPTAAVGVPYNATLVAACGTKLNYTYISGMPKGLHLSGSAGTISGTPTLAGVYSITLKLTGTNGTVTEVASLTVASTVLQSNGYVLTVSCGQPFTIMFTATGGVLPYTWSITPPLPTGFTFNTNTAIISGTGSCSQTPVTFQETLTVTDSSSPINAIVYNVGLAK